MRDEGIRYGYNIDSLITVIAMIPCTQKVLPSDAHASNDINDFPRNGSA